MPAARCADQDLTAVRGSALPPVPAGSRMLSRVTGTRRPAPGIQADGGPVTALQSPGPLREEYPPAAPADAGQQPEHQPPDGSGTRNRR